MVYSNNILLPRKPRFLLLETPIWTWFPWYWYWYSVWLQPDAGCATGRPVVQLGAPMHNLGRVTARLHNWKIETAYSVMEPGD